MLIATEEEVITWCRRAQLATHSERLAMLQELLDAMLDDMQAGA